MRTSRFTLSSSRWLCSVVLIWFCKEAPLLARLTQAEHRQFEPMKLSQIQIDELIKKHFACCCKSLTAITGERFVVCAWNQWEVRQLTQLPLQVKSHSYVVATFSMSIITGHLDQHVLNLLYFLNTFYRAKNDITSANGNSVLYL